MDGKPVSRTLKPIPNQFIRSKLIMLDLPDGLDGELITLDEEGEIESYNEIQSKVMSVSGQPLFQFCVFDYITRLPFAQRRDRLISYSQAWEDIFELVYVDQSYCTDKNQILIEETEAIEQGFEGLMLKNPQGYYKQGRATLNEGIIWKLKRFEDSEALVVGMEEEMENSNPIEQNELGHNYRSKSLQNMTPKGTMGKLICRDIRHPEYEQFEIGTGFTRRDREWWWQRRDNINPNTTFIVKYKFQKFGMKNKPRQPVFIGLRNSVDI